MTKIRRRMDNEGKRPTRITAAEVRHMRWKAKCTRRYYKRKEDITKQLET